MKKTITALLALAAVAACNKTEVVDMKAPQAISFDAPFIENVTKAIDPSYTATTLTSFNVYGTMTNSNNQTANIFNRVAVTKGATTNAVTNDGTYGQWGYASENTQYWVAGNTYAFAAVAGDTASDNTDGVTVNVTDDTKMPSTITYDASSQTDLLYAVDNHGKHGEADATNTNIAFTFNHLLAKAKFTFTNGYPAGYTVKVSDVTITNVVDGGTYTVNPAAGVSDWAASTKTEQLTFGNVVATAAQPTTELPDGPAASAIETTNANGYSANFERLLVPADYTTTNLVITFTAEVTSPQGIVVKTTKYTSNASVKLEAGNSYNFKAEIKETLVPITFSIETITGWDEENNDVTVQ